MSPITLLDIDSTWFNNEMLVDRNCFIIITCYHESPFHSFSKSTPRFYCLWNVDWCGMPLFWVAEDRASEEANKHWSWEVWMSGISKWMQALHSSFQKSTPLHHHNIYHRCTAYWGMTSMSERTTEQEVCLCNINSLNRYWSQKHDIHSCREAKRQEQVALISPFFVSNNLCSDSGKLLRVREGGKSEESCLVGDVESVNSCSIKG